jgi:hypothetical protein
LELNLNQSNLGLNITEPRQNGVRFGNAHASIHIEHFVLCLCLDFYTSPTRHRRLAIGFEQIRSKPVHAQKISKNWVRRRESNPQKQFMRLSQARPSPQHNLQTAPPAIECTANGTACKILKRLAVAAA